MSQRTARIYKASFGEVPLRVLSTSAALQAKTVICGPVVEADPNLDGWEKIWVYNGW
jgi:hypothetical protein